MHDRLPKPRRHERYPRRSAREVHHSRLGRSLRDYLLGHWELREQPEQLMCKHGGSVIGTLTVLALRIANRA